MNYHEDKDFKMQETAIYHMKQGDKIMVTIEKKEIQYGEIIKVNGSLGKMARD